jgi:hypothetical protein
LAACPVQPFRAPRFSAFAFQVSAFLISAFPVEGGMNAAFIMSAFGRNPFRQSSGRKPDFSLGLHPMDAAWPVA